MTASTNGSAERLRGFRAGLTIGQAASMLGVSPSTVRRWVRSGRLGSDQVSVGDGFEYRIPLEALEAMKGSTNPCADPAANGSTDATVLAGVDPSTERSAALAAYNAQLIAPLTAVIEPQHEPIVGQAERLERQAETIGRQGAELAGARADLARADAMLARQVAEQAKISRQARRLQLALAVAGALAVAAGLAPGWLR